jgi:hypothetical protein
MLTPISSATVRQMPQGKRVRLNQITVHNPLTSSPRGTQQYEVTVLNAGMFSDLELPLAWKALAGRKWEQMDRL